MPKIISLRRWHRKTFAFHDQEIDLDIKALTRAETPAFIRSMTKMGKAWEEMRADKPEGDESVEILEDAIDLLGGPEVLYCFSRFVKISEGQVIEFDGKPATPETLAIEGNTNFLMSVMTSIQSLAVLNAVEGKAYASRSGSPSEETADSVSAVTSTEQEVGTSPSTATPIPSSLVPSSPSTTV
jgi:hypothetical protein